MAFVASSLLCSCHGVSLLTRPPLEWMCCSSRCASRVRPVEIIVQRAQQTHFASPSREHCKLMHIIKPIFTRCRGCDRELLESEVVWLHRSATESIKRPVPLWSILCPDDCLLRMRLDVLLSCTGKWHERPQIYADAAGSKMQKDANAAGSRACRDGIISPLTEARRLVWSVFCSVMETYARLNKESQSRGRCASWLAACFQSATVHNTGSTRGHPAQTVQ
ncbi:hypothetical protein BU23DRAFT_569822 [Bimuria novae-zelandiae CBS 107.79]|uniref:Secreted protein n=1 Tax=Bimuria novae-zelandiae CBS 107.79 TaxID=1447943 RepID=A0A6A5V3Q9_9PLEO|nr:hypothetical protein BU23DRAFT_569822 [Bimuria novae-zelandiae CBS 107.79]